jgi:NADH-quinone oxidoreductase subunit D
MDTDEQRALSWQSEAQMLRGGGIEVIVDNPLKTEEMILNIGPQHPSTHGVLRVVLELDGELIIRAEPVIGYMHRGAEKLAEYRDPRQVLVLKGPSIVLPPQFWV